MASTIKELSHNNMNYLIEKIDTYSIMEFYKNCLLKTFQTGQRGGEVGWRQGMNENQIYNLKFSHV